jgi:hypothetical protein
MKARRGPRGYGARVMNAFGLDISLFGGELDYNELEAKYDLMEECPENGGNRIYLSLLKCPEERMVRDVSKSPLHEYWFA